MEFNRIGIVGLGLIGGSIGLDLQRLGYEVYGLTNRDQTAIRAKERGLAQFTSTNPNIIADCSIIILALPLPQLINPPQELIDALPQNAVITDVGSVKTPVIKAWQNLHPRFVGSHPMAGTIEQGVEAGRRDLFKNHPWISTPYNATDKDALKSINELAINLGSNWITTDPELHDQAVALISHLPVFISAALIQTVKNGSNNTLLKLTKAIASSGFADTTRVGGGNPQLGVAMASSNTSAILNALNSYRSEIDKLEVMIKENQWEQLKQELKETQSNRPDFLNQK